MLHYEELIVKESVRLAKLQKGWEAVVGEIWKLGASYLGEELMEEMMFTKKRLDESIVPISSPPSKAPEAASTLFISEYGSPPCHNRSRGSKKRVTFLEENVPNAHEKHIATPTTMFPNFIYQPSRHRKDTIPLPPCLPDDEIKELEKEVNELGKQELDRLHSIEKEHQAYWKKKTAQLTVALKSD
jgi:hypothetical protein